MKKIILVLLALCNYCVVNAQSVNTMDFDPTPFTGKWTATSEGVTYELTMIRDTVNLKDLDPNDYGLLEQINCRLIYKQNGNIIRTIEPAGVWSMLRGSTGDETTLFLKFFDRERRINGRVKFVLTGNNTASWELTRTEGIRILEPGEEIPTFDIPRHLTFRKVTDVIIPGNPVEGEILL